MKKSTVWCIVSVLIMMPVFIRFGMVVSSMGYDWYCANYIDMDGRLWIVYVLTSLFIGLLAAGQAVNCTFKEE